LVRKKAACSRPHFEKEQQWSVNDIWRFIMANQSVMWQLLSVFNVLTVAIG
jgi:hypothetical protein